MGWGSKGATLPPENVIAINQTEPQWTTRRGCTVQVPTRLQDSTVFDDDDEVEEDRQPRKHQKGRKMK